MTDSSDQTRPSALARQDFLERYAGVYEHSPWIAEQLFDAGLDSVRISMNSIREKCYHTYFRPKGYRFADVLKSIDVALKQEKFVAINYLNCPGFSDTPQESEALVRFLEKHPVNMIQWRNLNFDPLRYWKKMNTVLRHGKPLGMKKLLQRIQEQFPNIKFGYFNKITSCIFIIFLS